MASKHRILQLIDPRDADVVDQLTLLLEGLDTDSYDVTVAGPLPQHLRRRLSRRHVPWVNIAIPQSFSLRNYRAAAGQLQRLIKTQDLDLVHCHDLEATITAVLAHRALKSSKPAIVCSLHAEPGAAAARAFPRWLVRRGLRWVLDRCETLLTSSQQDLATLERLAPRAATKAQVVYPGLTAGTGHPYEAGVKRRQAGLHPDAAIVGLVSRLESGEGVETFLQAAAIVNSALPNVEFAILGEGSARGTLEQLAHQLGLGGACAFLGQRRDARQIIEALNVLVLLSDADGAPLRGFQALTAGLPVIVRHSHVLAELFAELPAVRLVDVTDSEQLAAAIRDELELPPAVQESEVILEGRRSITYRDFLVSQESYDLQESWSRAEVKPHYETPVAKALRERYGPERMVAQMEAIYHRILED